MKKITVRILALLLMLSIILSGCGSQAGKSNEVQGQSGDKPLKVAFLCNGNLGDKSFFDSANEGIQAIKNELGAEIKVIETGRDATKWEPALDDISNEDFDVIVVGTWDMKEILERIAPKYKDKKYILFDAAVDYSKGDYSNVYSISYRYNEGAYLAGAFAAKVTNSSMPLTNKGKVIGFIGGMDSPIINDYLVGYIEGAKYADPETKVAVSYVGDFANTTKGKEMAISQYNELNAGIIFSVAGQSGLGTIDAAKEQNKYVIGVDADQSMMFKGSDITKSNLILTSVVANVGNSLLRAVKLYKEGNFQWGREESLGLKEGTVELADNEFYQNNVPEEIKTYMGELSKKVASQEIKVDSAFELDSAKFNEILNSAKAK